MFKKSIVDISNPEIPIALHRQDVSLKILIRNQENAGFRVSDIHKQNVKRFFFATQKDLFCTNCPLVGVSDCDMFFNEFCHGKVCNTTGLLKIVFFSLSEIGWHTQNGEYGVVAADLKNVFQETQKSRKHLNRVHVALVGVFLRVMQIVFLLFGLFILLLLLGFFDFHLISLTLLKLKFNYFLI